MKRRTVISGLLSLFSGGGTLRPPAQPALFVPEDAAGWVVVHQAEPFMASQVMNVLAANGLTPGALDVPPTPFVLRHPGPCWVRIAVPPEQADRARAVLAEWNAACEKRADANARAFRDMLLKPLAPAAVAAAAFLAYHAYHGRLAETPWGVVALVWLAGFIVMAIKANTARR